MNSQELAIQILVENTANRKGLLGEHGLSYLIKTRNQSLLFDTGQGLALAHNASVLSVDLQKIDSIILSHGHYDHTGGLRFFSKQEVLPTIFAHPDVLQKRFAKNQQNHYVSVGVPEESALLFREKVFWTERPAQIIEGVWCTGFIPRENEWERFSGPFYLDEQGAQRDELMDDQSVYFHTKQGVVVLLGCAHAGVINTLQYIKEMPGGGDIHFVIGGMHLLHASPERIEWTIQELRRMNVAKIAPCHCTGAAASQALRNSFGGRYVECSVGTEFQWELV